MKLVLLPFSLLTAAVFAASSNVSKTKVREYLPEPVEDSDYGVTASTEKSKLGQVLFFDKILSGNKNISCATCHHPSLGSADGLALPFGEGALGLGPERKPGASLYEAVHGRVPRNSPGIFNVGATEFTRLFHDGRVEADPHGYYEGGFITPAKWKLPKGLDSVLAAQAMFPVASPEEMAGHKSENSVAEASSLGNAAGPGGVWEQLAKRLQAIPEYVELFKSAYPSEITRSEQITYVHAANAIAAFEADAFRADGSPFDQLLSGDSNALSEQEMRGLDLFYGKANCVSCHSGKFQTDHDFHAIAMPQIGPGKGDGNDGGYWRASGHSAFIEDFGRGRVTVRPEDNYKFRTPSLRNVKMTGPWGHAGSYESLEGVVRHHIDPVASLQAYSVPEGLLPEITQIAETSASNSTLGQELLNEERLAGFNLRDTWVQNSDSLKKKIAQANELAAMDLDESEINDLIAFLGSLTDPATTDLSYQVPEEVPSGLPVAD